MLPLDREIERLIRAFGRMPQPSMVDAYIECARDLPAAAVRRAVQQAIDEGTKAPFPAELSRNARKFVAPALCVDCSGRGYMPAADAQFDDAGLETMCWGRFMRCGCSDEIVDGHPQLVDAGDVRTASFARILARAALTRVQGVVGSSPGWIKANWSKDDRSKWYSIATRVQGFSHLVHTEDAIANHPHQPLIDDPVHHVGQLVDQSKGMPEIQIPQGVSL